MKLLKPDQCNQSDSVEKIMWNMKIAIIEKLVDIENCANILTTIAYNQLDALKYITYKEFKR